MEEIISRLGGSGSQREKQEGGRDWRRRGSRLILRSWESSGSESDKGPRGKKGGGSVEGGVTEAGKGNKEDYNPRSTPKEGERHPIGRSSSCGYPFLVCRRKKGSCV